MEQIMLAAGSATQGAIAADTTKAQILQPGMASFSELLLLLKPLETAARETSAARLPAGQAGHQQTAETVLSTGADLLSALGEALETLSVELASVGDIAEAQPGSTGSSVLTQLAEHFPQLSQKLAALLGDVLPGFEMDKLALATEAQPPAAVPAESRVGSELLNWLGTVLDDPAVQADAETAFGVDAEPLSASTSDNAAESVDAQPAPSLSSGTQTMHAAAVNLTAVPQQAAGSGIAPQTAQIVLPSGNLSISLQEQQPDTAADAGSSHQRQFALTFSDSAGDELKASLSVRRVDSAQAQPATPAALLGMLQLPGQQELRSAQQVKDSEAAASRSAAEKSNGAAVKAELAAKTTQFVGPSLPLTQSMAEQASATHASPSVAAVAAAAQAETEAEQDAIRQPGAGGMAEALALQAEEEEGQPRLVAQRNAAAGSAAEALATPLPGAGQGAGSQRSSTGQSRFSGELALSPLGELQQSAETTGGGQIATDTRNARLIEFSAPQRFDEAASQQTLNHREMSARVMEQAARFKAAGDGLYIARLALNPESLGEMHVNISVRGDNVSLQIAVVSTMAREQLQASLNALRQSLGEGGLNVVELRVINADPDGRGSGKQRQQGQQNQGQSDDNNTVGSNAEKQTAPLHG